jgi:hypothetical protein
MFTGLYMFVLPYAIWWPAGDLSPNKSEHTAKTTSKEPGLGRKSRDVPMLETVVPDGATVPIGWIAVGDPARILPPDQHDAIWAIQKPRDFPATAYGLNRGPDGSVDMHEPTLRLSESARRHRPEEP